MADTGPVVDGAADVAIDAAAVAVPGVVASGPMPLSAVAAAVAASSAGGGDSGMATMVGVDGAAVAPGVMASRDAAVPMSV